MKIGALIMAGGKSSRMGVDKASLAYGNDSFVSRIARTLSGYNELLLSLADDTHDNFGMQAVYDVYAGCGPIGGLHAALSYCASDALLTVPCDMPLFTAELGKYICSLLSDGYDAVVPTAEGRTHPLCAVYRKSSSYVFEKYIKLGDFRIRSALSGLNVRYAEIGATDYPVSCLRNINTREDYEKLINNIPGDCCHGAG